MRHLFVFLLCSGLALPALADPVDLPAGSRFETGFSPQGGALELIIKTITAAQQDIHVAAYGFSSKPIARALLDASKRGVHISVIADENESEGRSSLLGALSDGGIAVRVNGNYAIHHNKFMVIDDTTVETGSFNFTTAAARKNAENVLVISQAPALAASYLREWQKLWDEAEPFPIADATAPVGSGLPPATSGSN